MRGEEEAATSAINQRWPARRVAPAPRPAPCPAPATVTLFSVFTLVSTASIVRLRISEIKITIVLSSSEYNQ